MASNGTPVSTLATRITIDDMQAVESLRGIKNQVSSLMNSWKAQNAMLNSVGDHLGAAKAKYEGLGDAIQKQEEYITKLKSEMETIDTSTNKGSEAYARLTKQLSMAQKQLANLNAQQERAKKSMDYYASGADKVKSSLKEMTTSSNLMIEKLKAEGKTYQANYEQSRLYANQLSKMSSLHEKLKSSLNSIAAEQGKESDAYKRTASSLQRLDTEMAKTRSAQSKLNESFSSTNIAAAKIHDNYNKISKSVGQVGSGVKSMAGKIVSAGATAGVAVAGLSAGFVAASKSASEMQNTYRTTANLLETGGEKVAEVTKNVSEMQRDGRKYSLEYGKSQQEIAEAYQDLVKRGDTSKQALGAMRSEVQASVATGDELKDVTEVTSNVMESFGMKVDKNGKALQSTAEMTKRTKTAVNELAYAADKTSTNFQDLGVGMSYVGATAHGAGISLSETASAMGVLSNNGLEADKAGTGLRKVINSLSTAVKNINSADSPLKKLGITKNDLVDSSGNLKSLSDIMGVLGEKTKNMGTAEKNVVFNSLFGTTGQQAGEILADNANKLRDLNKEVANSTKSDYVGKLAEKNMGTAQNAMNRFKAASKDVQMTLASAVLPTVSQLAESMSHVVDSKGFRGMMNTLSSGIETVSNKLQGMFRYIDKNSAAFTSMGKSVATIIGEFSSGVWTTFSGVIKGISKSILNMFGDKSTGNAAKDLSKALADIASHKEAIKVLGETFATYFVAKKMLGFANSIYGVVKAMGALSDAIDTVKGGGSILDAISGLKNKTSIKDRVGKSAGEIAEDAVEKAGSKAKKGKILDKLAEKTPGTANKVANEAGKLAEGASESAEKVAKKGKIFGKLFDVGASDEASLAVKGLRLGGKLVGGLNIAMSAFDIYKGLTSHGTEKYTKAGSGIGSLLGTGIGAVLGGPVGAAIGGTLGNAVGNFAGKEIAKHTIKGPKISMKESYDRLHKENEAYIKQQTADLNTLLKSGDITKKEYNQRLKEIQDGNKRISALDKKSAEERNAVSKYYAKKRSELESKYDKQIEKDKKTWENKIYADAKKYGSDSIKVQEDQKKRELAIEKDKDAKKRALQKQANDFTKKSTIEEAKENETLTGKLKKANREQLKDYDKLVTQKGKLSNKQLQTIVNNAQTEYNKVTKLAKDEYNKEVSTAKKKYKDIVSQANKTRDDAVKAANDKYKKVVNAAYDEYSGTDKASTQQRDAVIARAKKQRDDSVSAANDQRNRVVKHAENQRDSSISIAEKQRSETVAKAGDQRDKITQAAKDQSHGVVDHATNQANSTMKANSEQASGLGKIWNDIVKFFNKLTKPFGVKSVEVNSLASTPTQIGGLAYASGGGVSDNGKALVGEAGPELRYKPYSGKFDILGAQGAQLADLEAGDEILNADDTAKLLSGNFKGTLPGYAKGTSSLSDFIKKVGDTAGNIFDGIKDDALKVIKDIGNPIDKLKDIAKKAFNLDSVKNLGSVPHDISKGAVDKSIDSIGKFIKKLVDKVKDHLDSEVAGITAKNIGPGAGNWASVIRKVADATHTNVSDSDMQALLARIQKESGGNQSIRQQVWDINMANGNPAQGLFQYVPSTFAAWAVPGHTNILSGEDQIYAVFNDSNWRSDIRMPGGWGPTGHRVFANGGIANEPSIFGEDGPEMAIPLASPKRTRGYELLGKVVSMFAAEEPSRAAVNTTDNSRVEELLEQNNALMQALINVANGQLNALNSGNTNTQVTKNAFYNAFGMDQKRTNFQSI